MLANTTLDLKLNPISLQDESLVGGIFPLHADCAPLSFSSVPAHKPPPEPGFRQAAAACGWQGISQPADSGVSPPEQPPVTRSSSTGHPISWTRQSKTLPGIQVAATRIGCYYVIFFRQPPTAGQSSQSQPPAERRTFITVLLAAEVFIILLFLYSHLLPLS